MKDKNESVRNEWIREKLTNLPAGKSILDAGAGELKWKNTCSHLRYISQDFCEYSGKGNSLGLQTETWDTSKIDIISDITQIPMPKESFDYVLCSEVLEHLPYPESAIAELSRILKKEGKLFVTAPFCSITHFSPYHFCTGFNKYWYESILPKYNLKVLEEKNYGDYYAYLQQEMMRLPSIVNRYNTFQMGVFDKMLCKILIKRLEKYNKDDNNSSELLCFGYMIEAQKV